MRCREHGQRDRQVEARALLPQAGGREIHGDPVSRPLETCRGDTRARCFASWHVRSARPTIVKPGRPLSTLASTSTRRASRPTRAWVTVRASTRPNVDTSQRSSVTTLCRFTRVRLRRCLWLWIALAVIVLGLWIVYAYNSLIRVRNEAETGWANIDVQLRRRADLIPNLVEAVKGYAAHEREVFDEVTRARAAVMALPGRSRPRRRTTCLGLRSAGCSPWRRPTRIRASRTSCTCRRS